MTWRQPWVWAALITLALPILIHLLGRGPARTQRFPTLQFLQRSRLLPTRRTRLHDLLLLLVRLATLALAVAALAQPMWMSSARQRAFATSMARLVIVDTSASVVRAVGGASALRDTLERTVAAMAGPDSGGVRGRIETASPAASIDGAVAWLAGQSERREIAIISDFQRSSIATRDLSRIPSDVGIRLVRLGPAPAAASDGNVQRDSIASDSAVLTRTVGRTAVRAVARVNSAERSRTQLSWSIRPSTSADGESRVTILAGDTKRTSMSEAVDIAYGIVPAGFGRPIVIVAADAPERESMLGRMTLPSDSWILQRIADVRESVMVQQSEDTPDGVSTDSTRGLTLSSFGNGVPAIVAMQDSIDGATRLVVLLHRDVTTVMVSAVVAALVEMESATAGLEEYEPSRLSDRELTAWRRVASPVPGRADSSASRQRLGPIRSSSVPADPLTGDSDGRWLWVGVLLLLAVETVVRRRAAHT